MMSKYAFGVDVGGTTVKLGLFNDEGADEAGCRPRLLRQG